MKEKVTVVIPTYNEEKNIVNCVESILQQTYPQESMHIFFCDGMSTDKTKKILEDYQRKYPDLITILDNKKRIVPAALNLCVSKLATNYMIRLDAHSDYPKNYIEECLKTIMEQDADNVGGIVENIGKGSVGEAFAQVLSSKFGVGNSGFRTGAASGDVDTVPFGTFKRENFEKFGMFDERLIRNQDIEYNYRIRKNGGKVYLNSDIHLQYHCKDSFGGIMHQAMMNGLWNVITMKLCPGALGIRHFIPLTFLLSLIILIPASFVCEYLAVLLALELTAYFSLDFIFSLKNSDKKYKNHALIKFILFPLYHLSYGAGSLIGIFKVLGGRY